MFYVKRLTKGDDLKKEIEYCTNLLSVVKKHENLIHHPKVSENLNYLEETLQDDIEKKNPLLNPETFKIKIQNRTYLIIIFFIIIN